MTSSWPSQSIYSSPWLVRNTFTLPGISSIPDNTMLLTSQGFSPLYPSRLPVTDGTLIKRIKWRQGDFAPWIDGHYQDGKVYLWVEDVPKPLLGTNFQILILTKEPIGFLDFGTLEYNGPVPDSMTVTLHNIPHVLYK